MRSTWFSRALVPLLMAAGAGAVGSGARAETSSPAGVKVEMTYLGNEGICLAAGGRQVAIDALHRRYPREPYYSHLSPEQLRKLETAQPPFDRIDVALVTHTHSDHFHPETAGAYLEHRRSALLVGARQVASVMQYYAGFPEVQSRIRSVAPMPNPSVTLNLGGIDIKAFAIAHSPDTQHLGYIVTLGGKKFAHFGDADFTADSLRPLALAEEHIDVAFIPYWILLEATGRELVQTYIKPRRVVAIHIPPGEVESAPAQIRQVWPGADALTVLLEKRIY